ncbi:MAG: hypothetical protein AABY93_16915 [Bacteroidota bacterium]
MKRIIIIILISIPSASWTLHPGTGGIKEKLQDFFFGISLDSDIKSIKEQLNRNPEFTLHSDPNLDVNESITSSISTNKNLNPVSTRNQLVISFMPLRNRNKEAVTFLWIIDYKLEDLAIAIYDFEKFKSEFKPYFEDFSITQGLGYQQEKIELLHLQDGNLEVIIKLMKSNNLSHTISVEYKEVRRKNKKI